MKVIGYLRVSTESQAATGYGMDAQRQAIQQRVDQSGWEVTWVEDAGVSGVKTERPGLDYALTMLRTGQADALVVSRLDRLARSTLHFADLLQDAQKRGWNLILLDLGMDLSTPYGQFAASILAAMAQLERQLISERTRAALAAAKDRTPSVRPGPQPRPVPEATATRLRALRGEGRKLADIAHVLTTENHPLPSGRTGAWSSTQVQRSLARIDEAGQR